MENSRTGDDSIRYGERNGRDTRVFFLLAQLCAYRHHRMYSTCVIMEHIRQVRLIDFVFFPVKIMKKKKKKQEIKINGT